MEYHLECQCGEVIAVAEAAAGAKTQCRCGRPMLIPSLRELRQGAGVSQPSLPPEMAVETLLLAGKLPEEDHCIRCGVTTEALIHCCLECERAKVERGSFWDNLPYFLAFGWLGGLWVSMARSRAESKERGKDRIFTVPLRVCENCRQDLRNPKILKDALRQVPLYRRLLTKYPQAGVTPSSGKGLHLANSAST